LTARTRIDLLFEQCCRFKPGYAVVLEADDAARLSQRLRAAAVETKVLCGVAALETVAALPEVSTVMAAIVGIAGLRPTLAAATAGKRVLLANKEALVTAGGLFMSAVRASGAELLPIDSEHNAVFQALPANRRGPLAESGVRRILLTASGGPFRTMPAAQMAQVTPEQAVAHPNWSMGRKISVDSATMMNKGLEVIEAHFLFGATPSMIEVVIHPQSVIHSMVQFVDGSVVAQLGTPDMRMPIAYGLSWPQRITSGSDNLNFHKLQAMTFEAMEHPAHQQRFPGLRLAWDALAAPSGTTAVLNAANEVAVDLFLNRQIRFDQIHLVNLSTLEKVRPAAPQSLEDLLEIDRQARAAATGIAADLSDRTA
jgi:1-deoxy-D-xylulose-5-phosphate reductoisomerase